MMRIWIDISNSPHVNFFVGMIRELQPNHEVVVTGRPIANTVELLQLCGLDFNVVGKHYGKNIIRKLLGFCIRTCQLFRFLRNRNIDVAISHSSFQSPVVARMLGAKCIYLNDNEHAQGNRIAFLLADRIMVPEYLDVRKIVRQWARPGKVTPYPGIKEGVYLWRRDFAARGPGRRDGPEPAVFIRPEPWTAQYYKGKRHVLDALLGDLKSRHMVVVLPRSARQGRHYRQARFQGINVPDRPVGLAEIMDGCKLFIGAGGTMTREAAVMGIPTISTYQDKLLDVDRYLIDHGAMVHKMDLDADFVESFMKEHQRSAPDEALLAKGRQAYRLIVDALLALGSSGGGKSR